MTRTAIDIMASQRKFDAEKLKEVDSIATTFSYAPIKVALCFGF